jgi:hypothetical protein
VNEEAIVDEGGPPPYEGPRDVATTGIRLWSHAMRGASTVLDRAARRLGDLAAVGHRLGDA